MTIIQKLIQKQPALKSVKNIGCYLPFIEYDKEKLLSMQEKNNDNYIWYYEVIARRTTYINEASFRYKFLENHYIIDEPYIVELIRNVKEHIPLLKEVQFCCNFAKFEKGYELEKHKDTGRNAAIFMPLTDNSSATDFYRNNKLIASFPHTDAMLLSVDIVHASVVTHDKITFQMGFYYDDWDTLLEFCRNKN
jgi:hypothetical protein